jgi:hypothetical protein
MRQVLAVCIILFMCLESKAQSIVIADSSMFPSHQLFFSKQGLDLSHYYYSNPQLNLSLNYAYNTWEKRNLRFNKAAIAGGLSVIFFTLYAVHHKSEPQPPYSYPEEPLGWIFLDPFLAAMGSITGALSVGYLVSGMETDRKMNKAIEVSRRYLMTQ